MDEKMVATHIQLDETDIKILAALQDDARLTIRELAAKVGRTPTPVYERVKRLESSGVIKGYFAILDAEAIGKGLTVFCNVKLQKIGKAIHQDFATRILQMPEVVECYNISGSFDYLLKVVTADMREYQAFVTDNLGVIDYLSSVESVFVMQQVKSDTIKV